MIIIIANNNNNNIYIYLPCKRDVNMLQIMQAIRQSRDRQLTGPRAHEEILQSTLVKCYLPRDCFFWTFVLMHKHKPKQSHKQVNTKGNTNTLANRSNHRKHTTTTTVNNCKHSCIAWTYCIFTSRHRSERPTSASVMMSLTSDELRRCE